MRLSNPKSFSNFDLALTRAIQRYDFFDCFCAQLASWMCFSSTVSKNTSRVKSVLATSAVFKIFEAIIIAYSIFVIHFLAERTWADERRAYEVMYGG